MFDFLKVVWSRAIEPIFALRHRHINNNRKTEEIVDELLGNIESIDLVIDKMKEYPEWPDLTTEVLAGLWLKYEAAKLYQRKSDAEYKRIAQLMLMKAEEMIDARVKA